MSMLYYIHSKKGNTKQDREGEWNCRLYEKIFMKAHDFSRVEFQAKLIEKKLKLD